MRRKDVLRTTLGCLSALVLAFPAIGQVVEAPTEYVGGTFDATKAQVDQEFLSRSLLLQEGKLQVEPIVVEPAVEELARLANASEDQGRLLVGFTQSVSTQLNVNGPKRARSNRGHLSLSKKSFRWFDAIRTPGATAVRLHFTNVDLPEGVNLYVYNSKGEAFGPYRYQGAFRNGDFWSHTVSGDEIRVQVVYQGDNVRQALAKTRFEVKEIVHLGENFFFSRLAPADGAITEKAFCSQNASCVVNASCASIPSAIQPARNATAHIQFVVGSGSFICSGGLINDTDTSTTIPYFLTANHCLSSAASASSVEAYFQWSVACGASCPAASSPPSSVPRMNGATLKATGSSGDYTLLQLNGSLPAGSALLGWTTSNVANSNNTSLFRVSHPKGAPQAYSTDRVDTSAGTCLGAPRGAWIYSRNTSGATEGGSSGSVVLNSSGQIVGQLTGACGSNTGNVCDDVNNATLDGALAGYFSAVDDFLDPSTGGGGPNSCVGNCGGRAPGGCYCDSACSFFGDCCSDKVAICG